MSTPGLVSFITSCFKLCAHFWKLPKGGWAVNPGSFHGCSCSYPTKGSNARIYLDLTYLIFTLQPHPHPPPPIWGSHNPGFPGVPRKYVSSWTPLLLARGRYWLVCSARLMTTPEPASGLPEGQVAPILSLCNSFAPFGGCFYYFVSVPNNISKSDATVIMLFISFPVSVYERYS